LPADKSDTTPPDVAGRSLEDVVVSLLYDHDAPYWVRRNKSEKEPWEVCYHGEKGVFGPVPVARFYDQADAKAHAVKLTADLLRRIANGQT
jgi:hypothetical protein